ncbi:ABC transporter substrate-binding protein [Paenibacillus daejeonensis]|uniref:ABC transporter substrate-binding protein n=1 Tax=Paenibacillus daejeonensis TaxID=135193 RepID=UPI00036A0EB3|nr:ABC transporter substrate-binding protein [Paenibacillus daejeonensis]
MYSTRSATQTKTSRSRIILSLSLLLVLMLVLQACGGGSQPPAAGSESRSGSNSSGSHTEQTASEETGSTPQASVDTLVYGFVGTNQPGAIEGWGFHTGIIQEELKPYGINNVELVPFQTGPDLNESVISGRIDVGNSGDTPALLARSTGAKTRLVNFTNTEVNSVLIGRKDGPQTVEELKKVAVVKGSLMYRFLVGYLEEKGLTDQVEVININSIPDTEAALLRGEIDAYAYGSAFYSGYKLLQEGHPLLAESREYPHLLSVSVVYTTDDYLEKFPGFQDVWREALRKSYEDLSAKPDEYYAWLAESTGTPEEALREIQPIELLPTEALSAEGIERIKASKDFLVAENLARRDFDIDEWIVN